MSHLLPALGVPIGAVLWYVFLRPFQLREHERNRRAAGLRPARELPEDRR